MPDAFPRPVDPPSKGPVQVGLLGRDIGGSLSPLIHREAALRTGVDLTFNLLDVATEDELRPALRQAHRDGWQGLSVTMPWKRCLSPYLLGMSPDAISIGSVNLLVRADEGWIGENSDAEGFLRPLAQRRLAFSHVLLLGAGGAARAVAHVLASMPFVEQVWVQARRPEAARELVQEFATERACWEVLPMGQELPCAVDLLVNATPVGQDNVAPGALPCLASYLHADLHCYELVTHPHETALVREARARGASIIHGGEMLLGQARRAFSAWTGQEFPTLDLRPLLGLDDLRPISQDKRP
jgi:shikimate dehydrogenase